MREQDQYFFAAGKRVPLRADPSTAALALERLSSARLPRAVYERLVEEAVRLRSGVGLVPASTLPEDLRQQLDAAGALLPVFVEGEARIVVLAEVRVEVTDANQAGAVREYLAGEGVAPEAIEERGTELRFTPSSQRPAEALRMANEIHERLHPPMAQARFLRVVPKWR